ncbi:hypothetical protein [Gluconobacter sp. Dm-74]
MSGSLVTVKGFVSTSGTEHLDGPQRYVDPLPTTSATPNRPALLK